MGVFYVSHGEPSELMQFCVDSVADIDAIAERLAEARVMIEGGKAARVITFLPPGYWIPYSGKLP